jgi:hypothetical protein
MLPEFIDLRPEGLQPLLVLPDQGQDRRPGGKPYLTPQVVRDWRPRLHAADLRASPATGKSSP